MKVNDRNWVQWIESATLTCWKTDWRVSKTGEDIIDVGKDAVIFHFKFSESACIVTNTVFRNNKPWFRDEVRLLCRKKYEAFKNSVRVQYKCLNYEFQKAVEKNAKACYKDKLETKLQGKDVKGVKACRHQRAQYQAPA